MKYSAPTNSEITEILNWLESEPSIPENIKIILQKILSIYDSLTKGAQRAKNTLTTLRQAMGILPKSEKGTSDKTLSEKNINESAQKEISELKSKKQELDRQSRVYSKQLEKLIASQPQGPRQLEFDFESAGEMLFSMPATDRGHKNLQPKVERMKEFGTNKGLRSTYDQTTRVDLSVNVTEVDYKVETLEDPLTGKKVRASMIEEGPPGFQLTWKAIANLIKMHVGFAIPINRMALMIGQPEFTSGKICRVLDYIAQQLLPIYFVLIEQMADLEMICGDDTSTKILELDEPQENTIASKIDQYLGWSFKKANGSGDKKAINVSFISGRTEPDPRSTIRFFRTHTGSVGNLIEQLLELRDPKLKKLIFQGDLSGTNTPHIAHDFEFITAGCGAHARRPFWKHRSDDEDLCYFMLRGFLMLSQIEKRIDYRGRSEATILKYRRRYSAKVWQALKNRCDTAVTGKLKGKFPLKFGMQPRLWPTGMEITKACNYVINNFSQLTLYINNPHLHYTNNGSERALRIEKCMLSSSKFRKTRKGRAVLDVLRTINATCAAAKLDITVYLKFIFKNMDELKSSPELFTPFQVALKLQSTTNKN